MVDPSFLAEQSATRKHGEQQKGQREGKKRGMERGEREPRRAGADTVTPDNNTPHREKDRRGWTMAVRYLHEDSVPNMAGPGAAMEIGERGKGGQRERGRGGGLSRQLHRGGHQSTQCSQPASRPSLSDAQMLRSLSRCSRCR